MLNLLACSMPFTAPYLILKNGLNKKKISSTDYQFFLCYIKGAKATTEQNSDALGKKIKSLSPKNITIKVIKSNNSDDQILMHFGVLKYLEDFLDKTSL